MCRISSSFARIAPKIFIRFVTVCPPRCAAPFAACCYSRRRLPLFLFSTGAFPPRRARFYAYITNIIYKPAAHAARRRITSDQAQKCVSLRPHCLLGYACAFGCACPVRTLLSGAHAANCRTEFAAVRRISHIRYTRLMPPKADVQIAASKTQPTLCPHRKIMQAGHAPAFKQNSGPAARELKPVGKSSRTKLKPLRKQSLNFTVKITQTEKSLRDKKSLRINQMLWRVSVKRT